jgi:thiol:disulfide interchange protein DsbD
MALTFTIVSFTCVAPFLGGFGGMAASGQFSWLELILGALVFSTTFAAPFFVLALFPSLIKKLPKSGSWLNSVKVVMGFLEIAAALKFFRTAELRILPEPTYLTYDLVMGIWVALAVICGLYLLNLFRLNHDEPQEHIGVVRMLLGLGFIALGIYLSPALFKHDRGDNQRPAGVVYAWVDSFLLPDPSEPSKEELPWSANLKGTIDEARKELEKTGKPQYIFLDNTGVTCTNCKINERTIFPRAEIHKLFGNFHLVQHYTDEVPAAFYPSPVTDDRRIGEAESNLKFQREVIKDETLPRYVTFEVTKDKVYMRGIYQEAKINDVAAFAEFLRDSSKPRPATK